MSSIHKTSDMHVYLLLQAFAILLHFIYIFIAFLLHYKKHLNCEVLFLLNHLWIYKNYYNFSMSSLFNPVISIILSISIPICFIFFAISIVFSFFPFYFCFIVKKGSSLLWQVRKFYFKFFYIKILHNVCSEYLFYYVFYYFTCNY